MDLAVRDIRAAQCGRSDAAVRINRIFATGLRGLRRCSLVGLRRRNNELNELTNCRAARVRRVRINRIFATGLRGCAAIRCWPQTA